jgi:TRAP-type mannitol/chloroaromatic compound transport system substrate-binding protein
MSSKQPKTVQPLATGRRKFLGGAAAAAAGATTLGFPMIARAQAGAVNLRFQSTWPTKDIFHEYALDFAKKVNDMSGGRLKIEVLPAGAVVKAFDLLDAVHKGTLDGGHGVCAYWYGKNTAYSLFGTGPAIGFDSNTTLAWFYHGGGRALYDELVHDVMKLDVEGFLTGPQGTQPLGWFKKPITKPTDFKGMKYRTVGLSIDVFKQMGASVVALPGAEIVAGLDRGLIDAAEFNNPSSDRALGFPDVSKTCMVQSYHQPGECFEIVFNKKKYDALPADMKSIIKYACEAASADMSWKAIDRYSQDYIEMRTKLGVRFYKTPTAVLEAQMKAWDSVVAEKKKENPFFDKVLKSQMEFAKRAVGYQIDFTVSPQLAYNHWFGQKAASPKQG